MVRISKIKIPKAKWYIDDSEVFDDTHIFIHSFNRGQEKTTDGKSVVCSFKAKIERIMFIESFELKYQQFLFEEKNDDLYRKGEDCISDKLRELSFPSYLDLVRYHTDFARLITIELEQDVFELFCKKRSTWKQKYYFICSLENIVFGEKNISLEGSALYKPNHISDLLNNLIKNISDLSQPKIVIIESLKELKKGGDLAKLAIPYVEKLRNHKDHEIRQLASEVVQIIIAEWGRATTTL